MSQILVEQQGGIAVVTLNRPEKRNALSPEMVVRLAEFWREVAADHAIRIPTQDDPHFDPGSAESFKLRVQE